MLSFHVPLSEVRRLPTIRVPVIAGGMVLTGGSFTGFTVIVNVCDAEVSTPPFAVPPLSESVNVTVAEPLAFAAGV